MPRTYTSLQTVKEANAAYAQREGRANWFAADAMSFFSTTFPDGQTLIHGCLFITGETYRQDDPSFGIWYTVRRAMPSGRIETIGKFQGHETIAQARAAAHAVELSDLDAVEV